jgi:ATP/maltotriose-dependent transcriptional regulator MalT
MAGREEHEFAVGRSHIIERPRLTRLLDEATAPAIMLIAPAGYGKTTLARQWLATREHAWYQGSTASSDVAALALGIAEAAAKLIPGVGQRLREWLPTSREPEDEVHVIAALLGDDLATWPDEAWFVIDDYQFLTTPAAEDLVRHLFASTNRRLFVTSKRRPGWSSARDVLYGNIFEVGQSSLAMSFEEANRVLESTDTETPEGLVALADGWPAVIGLAALAPPPIAGDRELPEALDDYLAEELFMSLPHDTRRALLELALVPPLTRDSVDKLLGSGAHTILRPAVSAGAFLLDNPRRLDLHPLIRTFLLRNLIDLPRSELAAVTTSASTFLIKDGAWDAAFAAIRRCPSSASVDLLLSEAITPLTNEGRLSTLRKWLSVAHSEDLRSPYIDLADAELSFRQANYARAETLASASAEALPLDARLKSAALYRAGQSSHLLDRPERALDYFHEAREMSLTSTDLRNAIWGQFISSIEIEDPAASTLLSEFIEVGTRDRDTTVRTANGELLLAIRTGGLTHAIPECAAVTSLVSEANDPIVRSSFWHVYAAALMVAARYSEALEAVEEALKEIEHSYIDFARPYVLVNRVAANIGLRRLRNAEEALTAVERFARERPGDCDLEINAKALRCRLRLQQGAPDEALEATAGGWSRPPSQGLRAEFLATRGMALACGGKIEDARSAVERAQAMSGHVEPQLLCQWTRAVCALLSGETDAATQVVNAYEKTTATGAFDFAVFAYRLHPKVLSILSQDKGRHEPLADLLVRANDTKLARTHKIRVAQPWPPPAAQELTTRETEVYSLLAEGRTNREIASALFISELTAKTHVSRILRKLGVRSRTEAALKATRED